MARIFKTPFGAQGDTEQVPEAPQGDGSVSLTQGFGYDYEREYEDPAAKDIRREVMNGLFHDITEAIGDIQLSGIAKWSADAAPYPAGSIVCHNSVAWLSKVGNNTTTPSEGERWTAIDTVVKWVSGDKIITVADSGADFTTVMGAVAEAMKWRSIDGSVIVEIQSGYLVTEQLFFIDNDYSHINIKAQIGATIIVDHNSMSVTDFEGLGDSGFILCARGKSPMFHAQFEFLTRPAGTISGAMAAFSGEIYFGNNSGVKGAGRHGVIGQNGGSVSMGNGNDFSGAGINGVAAARGGSVVMGNNNNSSGAGNHGAIGSDGGSVSMGNNNDFSGAGDNGVIGYRGGSVSMGNGNDFSGAGINGVYGNVGGSVTMGDNNDFSGAVVNGAYSNDGGSVSMGNGNDFSGVSVGSYSFSVATNGLIQAGAGTIFTADRERSQAAGTITTRGLIMG